MGSARVAASFISAVPPARDPVNATALTRRSRTSASPKSLDGPLKWEKTPSGKPHSAAASAIAPAASSDVPGCEGCAFTITGQPAARADAVSSAGRREGERKIARAEHGDGAERDFALPQIGARQRLAFSLRRIDGARRANRPAGRWLRKGEAGPWFFRARPSRRARGNPVSKPARSSRESPSAMIFSAQASRNRARVSSLLRGRHRMRDARARRRVPHPVRSPRRRAARSPRCAQGRPHETSQCRKHVENR